MLHAELVRSGPSGEPPGSYESVLSIGLGGAIEYPLVVPGPVTPRIALDLALTMPGRSEDSYFTGGADVIADVTFNLTTRALYITATPTLALHLARGPVQPYLTAGPVAAVKMRERTSRSYEFSEGYPPAEPTDFYPGFTTGASAGAGVHLPGALSLGALRVEVRATRMVGRTGEVPEVRHLTNQRAIEVRAGIAL